MMGEVGRVVGEERHAGDIRRGGDREVDGPPAWLSAALGNRCGKSAPLAGYAGVDRERVERRLDHAEPLGAPCPLIGVSSDENAEVKLG